MLLVSIAGLFLELLLIRWLTTEIRIFAYLQNTVLVVCFLGLGLGCFSCREPIDLSSWFIGILVLVTLLVIPITRQALGSISEMLSVLGDLAIWHEASQRGSLLQTVLFLAIGLSLTFLVMALVWDLFIPVGRLLGRLFEEHPRTIVAYSVNVAGSLLGVWLFVLLSGWSQPPLVWITAFAIFALLLSAQLDALSLRNAAVLLATLAVSYFAGWEPGAKEVWWSPYQKLVLRSAEEHQFGQLVVTVNNVGYQGIVDLRPETIESQRDQFPPEQRGLSQYDLPSLFHPNPESMLIVGTGTGNDVAGALRHNPARVTAVEIDPVICSIGRRWHPERPYDSPKVTLVLDDARSFFASSKDKFDVISFGLLDSHTTTAMTNARLDHYVYTIESMRQVKGLLKDGGIVVLSFAAFRPFLADRMASVLKEVFGGEPVCLHIPGNAYGWGGTMFVAGNVGAVQSQIRANPRLATLIDEWNATKRIAPTYTTRIATDDWPYIYLESPTVPLLYYLLAGLLLLLFWRGQRQLKDPRWTQDWGREHWHFFFLGAAFMLLEVQNISKASVVLGNTWLVNAVMISAILIMVLVANAVVAWLPRLPLALAYSCLGGSCLGLYFLDLARLGSLAYPLRASFVGGLASLPMLFSGIVFARSFAAARFKDRAFGANILGSLIGGLLQSLTFVTGIRALLLVVLSLYLLAIVTSPGRQDERHN